MKNIKNNLLTELPLFPLDKCILLPGGNLPLNIFEERYIDMLDYALKNKRLIGMIQPISKDGNDLFKVGCAGKITSFLETNDNRYIVNLKGTKKFTILKEKITNQKFRVFHIQYENMNGAYGEFNKKEFNLENFVNILKQFFKENEIKANLDNISKIDIDELIITIAMTCPFSSMEKQALLECNNLNSVKDTLMSLLKFSNKTSSLHETIN